MDSSSSESHGGQAEEMRLLLKQKAHGLFSLCDKENKGYAYKKDMDLLMQELSLTPEQLDEVFEALDKDKNGCLTLEEFTEGLGMFLGIDCHFFQTDYEESYLDDYGQRRTLKRELSVLSREEQEENDQKFEDFLDELGAQGVFKDEDYIRHMWDKVKLEDPTMLDNFEQFLGKITVELKNTKDDYFSLENTLKNRADEHEEQVQALYSEMEAQLQAEKEAILAQEKSKELKMRNELEEELQYRDKQLQELLSEHAELEKELEEINALDSETKSENQKLIKERDDLELRLSASDRRLKDMQLQLENLRKRSLEERRKRAKAAFKVSEDIALEREDLVKQLQELKKVNKNLLDEKDELALATTNTISQNQITPGCSKTKPNLEEETTVPDSDKILNVATLNRETLSQNNEDVCSSLTKENQPINESFQQTCVQLNTLYPAKANNTKSDEIPQTFPKTTFHNLDDECEVDDQFFENNSKLLLPHNDFLQNNLNLSSRSRGKRFEKIAEVDEENLEDDFDILSPDKVFPDTKSNTFSKTKVKEKMNNKGKSNIAKLSNVSPERIFKVVFIGDSGVGKTSLIHRFCHDSFRPTFNATVGVDFQVKTMKMNDQVIALQLWDTAGQERFRSITQQYYRKADGIVIAYDVTVETSFKNVRNWVSHVQENADSNVVLLIIGNKIDLCKSDDDRVVKTKDGARIADEFGTLFYETSAKTGSTVQEAMEWLAILLQDKEDEVIEKVLRLQSDMKSKKKCCG